MESIAPFISDSSFAGSIMDLLVPAGRFSEAGIQHQQYAAADNLADNAIVAGGSWLLQKKNTRGSLLSGGCLGGAIMVSRVFSGMVIPGWFLRRKCADDNLFRVECAYRTAGTLAFANEEASYNHFSRNALILYLVDCLNNSCW